MFFGSSPSCPRRCNRLAGLRPGFVPTADVVAARARYGYPTFPLSRFVCAFKKRTLAYRYANRIEFSRYGGVCRMLEDTTPGGYEINNTLTASDAERKYLASSELSPIALRPASAEVVTAFAIAPSMIDENR